MKNTENKLDILKLKNTVIQTKELGGRGMAEEKTSELKCSMKEFTQNTPQRCKKKVNMQEWLKTRRMVGEAPTYSKGMSEEQCFQK